MRHEVAPTALARPGDGLAVPADVERLGVTLEPVVDLASGTVAGHHASARWLDGAPRLAPTVLPPSDPEAARVFDVTIIELATFAARERCELLTVPVSLASAASADLRAAVSTAIVTNGRPRGGLRLAVDAADVHAGGAELRRAAHRLERDLGIRLVVRGLGPGHLSWRELSLLPLVGLEVDAAIVRDHARAGSRAIVRAVAATGAAWDLEVGAAGVDEPGALAAVTAAGCTHARGTAVGS